MVDSRIHMSEKPWKIADFNCELYKSFLFFGIPIGGHLAAAFNIQIKKCICSRKSILFGRKKNLDLIKITTIYKSSIIDPLHPSI